MGKNGGNVSFEGYNACPVLQQVSGFAVPKTHLRK
jgi:hypothetical protein